MEEVVRRYPDLFKEGKKKPRQILQFKRIPRDDYVFGSCVKSVWKVSNETNNHAKLLITKEWLDQFVASHSTKDAAPETTSPPQNRSDPAPTSTMVKDAPPVLELTDAEKFKDEKGNVLEIEVRGMRDEDGCFFRVKDVARCFNDVSIYENIPRTHTSYRLIDDYVYFYRPYNIRSTDDLENQSIKELFFTYNGILRYLFVSENPNARAFRKWASRVLFAMQMGTAEQRESVASELLGVSVETVGKFMSACVREIPMVYMLHLGNVPDSVHVEGDRNDFLLFKIGQHAKNETECGFKGRCKGHQQEFREFRDEMSYLHFVFLDPMYVSEAERAIKDYFQEFRCGYKDKNEVYLIPSQSWPRSKIFSAICRSNTAGMRRTCRGNSTGSAMIRGRGSTTWRSRTATSKKPWSSPGRSTTRWWRR